MDTTKLTSEQIDSIIDKFPGSLEQFLRGAQYSDALTLIADFEDFIKGLSVDERYKEKFNAEQYAKITARLNKQKEVVNTLKENSNK